MGGGGFDDGCDDIAVGDKGVQTGAGGFDDAGGDFSVCEGVVGFELFGDRVEREREGASCSAAASRRRSGQAECVEGDPRGGAETSGRGCSKLNSNPFHFISFHSCMFFFFISYLLHLWVFLTLVRVTLWSKTESTFEGGAKKK